jgi:hypothetical protein
MLITPFFDLRQYPHGELRFKHICMVAAEDEARIEYRFNELGISGQWKPIPFPDYRGNADNYANGFGKNSYPDWNAANPYSFPGLNFWKEEIFDLTTIASFAEVQFRFVIKKGNRKGTQFSYGWLIDDFMVVADQQDINMPIIEFAAPLIKDTLHQAGPFNIFAKVQSASSSAITNVNLKYAVIYNNTVTDYSVPMTHVQANMYQATVPSVLLNRRVVYAVEAEDALNNKNAMALSYIVTKDHTKNYDSNALSIVSLDSPSPSTVKGGVQTDVVISLRNEGDYNLTNVTFYWSVNGILQTPFLWSGDLLWGVSDLGVKIGEYTPIADRYDTLVIWGADINNKAGIHSDSLTARFYGCTGAISGTVRVSASDGDAFSNAVELLQTCGTGGDITFLLEDGTYNADIDLTNLAAVTGNYHLTIASASGNRDNVILRAVNGSCFTFNNTNNVTLDKITIDASRVAAPAVLFTGSCTNIVISNCALLGNITGITSALSGAPITKAYAGVMENIRFTKNFIRGGYYGICFYGGSTGNFGKNIVIDSNELTSQYYYGMYLYYNELQLLHNTINYHDGNGVKLAQNNWRGIQTGNCNGNIIGNKIYQWAGLTASEGMFIHSMNQYQKESGIIANNEIIMQTAGTTGGVYLSTETHALFAHNSVYVYNVGTTSATRALTVTDNASNRYTIKNNLLVLDGAAGFAVYLAGVNYTLNYDIDYNNYYVSHSAGNIGYASGDKKTLANWKATVAKDKHSVNVLPVFVDSTVDLQLSSYTPFAMPYLPEVTFDKNNNIRAGITSVGAYGHVYTSHDAFLSGIIDWRTSTLATEKDTVKVVLCNGGTTPLTSVDIAWSFNGKTEQFKTWNGNLSKGQSDTITLGEVVYTSGMNSLKVWVKDFANDEYRLNDTLYAENEFCDAMFSGTYAVGTSGVFPSIEAALERINICGMDGPVVLALQDGKYTSTIDLSKYKDIPATSVNTITINSLSGNRDKVIIKPSSGPGIVIGGIQHFIIDNITVDVSSKDAYGIQFTNACENVTISNCNIKANPTATSSAAVPVYKAYSTNLLKNVTIKNNTLNGGYYGIQLLGGNSMSEYGTGLIIDSNIVTNTYYYGILVNYADVASLSYNTVLSRSSNVSTGWYGLYLSYVNANVKANKIRQLSSTITSPTGIYLNSLNTENTSVRGLIANNEVIVSTTGSFYGLNVAGAAVADIVHNSVYVDGAGTGRAVSVSDNAASRLTIKNNNLVTVGGNAYPLYLSGTTVIAQCDIDYNNYYAPQFVGYAGANITDIPSWRAAVPQDIHSTDNIPDFVNVNNGLQIQSTLGFRCPAFPAVGQDIDNLPRNAVTSKGAYHIEAYAADLSPVAIADLPTTANIQDEIPVEAVILNAGADTVYSFDLHWEVNGVTKGLQWIGTLEPEQQIRIVIDTLLVLNGDNGIVVWTSNPNQTNDADVSNDTLWTSVTTCNVPLHAGTYTVGHGKDFFSITSVLSVLNTCGIDGDVVFSVYPGKYETALLLENIAGVNDTNTLSFVAAAGNAGDVIIRGVEIGADMNKISIENITIDGMFTNAGVKINTPIKDVTIYGCTINAGPYVTGGTSAAPSGHGIYGIYLNAAAGNNANNIRIAKNTIDGGYAGIYMTGVTNFYAGKDVYIDSNYLINQGCYGIYLQHVNIESVSHNTLLSRETPHDYWRAVYLQGMNISLVNANKIRQRCNEIKYPTGIILYALGVNNLLQEPALITNNEIYIYSTSGYSYCGMMLYSNTNSKILFNTIYADGKLSSAFDVANNSNIRSIIKYNNFIAADSCWPFYFIRDIYKTSVLEMGSNNYYSPRWTGHAGEAEINYTSIKDWLAEMTFEVASISVKPDFVNMANSLELSDYSNFLVPATVDVKKDITGKDRIGVTAVGCYSIDAPRLNLALETVENWANNPMAGDKDTLKVVIRNGGSTPITSAAISYDFNGVVTNMPAWTGYLEIGDADTLTLGEFQYHSGTNRLSVWIDSLPGLTDLYTIDDTLSVSGYFCDSVLNGTYRIGSSQNAAFSSIEEAVDRMYSCGINGQVRFEIEDGTYLTHVRLEKAVPGASKTNTVTFTSHSGNASNVIVQRSDNAKDNLAPFMLEKVSDIIISKLTLSAVSPSSPAIYNYSNGIVMKDACHNITVDSCIFTLVKFGTPSSSSDHAGISKPNGTGSVSNIRITNNIFDGGVYAVYMTGASSPLNRNIYIANNISDATDKGSISLQYVDTVIIEKNSLKQRNEAAIGSLQMFQAIYLSTVNNLQVLQNTIKISRGIYGMCMYGVNNGLPVSNGLIANNEIIMNVYETSATAERYGIYMSGVRARMYHNSVLITGTSLGHGLYVSSTTGTSLDLQNNILLSASTGTGYPVYFATSANAANSNFAYNNYYSLTNNVVGYTGIMQATLSDWVAAVPSDIHSVSLMPAFVDRNTALGLQSDNGIKCPVLSAASEDILSVARVGSTVMGAYHFAPFYRDVLPYAIVSPTATLWDTADVTINIQTLGLDTLSNLNIHWTVNGQAQPVFHWTGKLAPNTISNPFTIGRINNYSTGSNELVIWTAAPNGIADEYPDNDTIRAMLFACDSALNGFYKVGAAAGDFATVKEAVRYICACGVSGATTFELENQEFVESVEFVGPISGSSPSNIITFTSKGGHYDSTSIRREKAPNTIDPALTLRNVSNINFTHLKISGQSVFGGTYSYAAAVALDDGCENIEFNGCKLEIPYFNTTTDNAGYAVISRPYGTLPVSNIRFINNIISGGAYGIYHSGPATGTARDNNILVQGNEFINADKYGIRFATAENVKISGNTITQRPFNGTKQAFYGISINTITGDGNVVNANRVKADSLYGGIELFGNTYGLVSNNEVIAAHAVSSVSGIYIAGATTGVTRVINNSVLIAKNVKPSTVYSARGIYLSSSYKFECKNNHFVTFDTMSVPIYIATTFSYANHDIDYNNYYNPYHIGYVNSGLKDSLPDWTKTVISDVHSISEQPVYDNPGVSLQYSNTANASCPAVEGVTTDIDGYARYGTTVMGAYVSGYLNTDAALSELANIPTLTSIGEKYTPSVKISNFGTNQVTSVVIKWSLNGNTLPAYSKTWTGVLNTLDHVVFSLDTLTTVRNMNDLVVWIQSVNNGVQDEFPTNDTLKGVFYACDSMYHGNYIVGSNNGHFPTLHNALTTFRRCGVNGDIALFLESGTYKETWNLSDLDYMNGYNLTITSLAHHKDSVVLEPRGGTQTVGITLGNTNNLTLKHITVNAAPKAQKCIQIAGSCKNIVIDSCNIYADRLQASTVYAGISKESGTGSLENMTITNCVLEGGYEAVRLCGLNTDFCKNITIENNRILYTCFQAVYLYYLTNSNIAYNYITPRSSNYGAAWHGIYAYSMNVCHITGNRIYANSPGISSLLRGLQLYYADMSSIVSNNEIILISGANSTEGIYMDYPKGVSLYNNSIYTKKNGTTGTTRAFFSYINNSTERLTLKNNIFVAEGGAANATYAIYLYGTLANHQAGGLITDYNNYYSTGTDMGYAGGSGRADLSAWKAALTMDTHSANLMPAFTNTNISLEMSDYTGLACPRHANALHDILGEERTLYTAMGAYNGYILEWDIELAQVVSPSNVGDLCAASYLPVQYLVRNNGFAEYDFSVTPLELHFNMTGLISFDTTVVVHSGILKEFSSVVVELKDALNVSFAGDYSIEAWISLGTQDFVPSNDTLRTIYRNTKIALPFDDDFSTSVLTGLTVESILGDSVWHVEEHAGYDSIIEPYYGSGMLVFKGEKGTISRISTGQLELNRTQQPVLEFWYAHDNAHPELEDQLDVRLTYDGGNTHTTLFNLIKYDPTVSGPTWKRYFVDLSQYQDSSCVIISFEGYSYGGIQHIDRITVSSNQDISVSEVILSDYDICNLTNKKVQVVVTNETGQNVDFSLPENNTALCVMIFRNGNLIDSTVTPLHSLLEGLASDTVTVDTPFDLEKGNMIFKAYLTSSIDNNPVNDRLSDTIILNPDFSIQIQKLSTGTGNPVQAEIEYNQEVIITNTGNIDLPNITLTMRVLDGSGFTDTISMGHTLLSGSTETVVFNKAYSVPWTAYYDVEVLAYLECDPLLNRTNSVRENVNMTDLRIVDISHPADSTTDVAGSMINVSLRIQNRNAGYIYNEGAAKVGIQVRDENGSLLSYIDPEELPEIGGAETISYTFKGAYTVPNVGKYYLTTYLNSEDASVVDVYSTNDTVTLERMTNVSISDKNSVSFTMEQNIPNPAKESTVINYSVPQDGEIIFQIYSVSGQLLYTMQENVSLGTHQIALNLSDYAAGVYFYSIEYKGQRLVKRMSLKH